jgi:endonuclease YncB( thermonuclease family)
VQYRVQFIDASDKVVRETQAEARSAANAFLLVADNDFSVRVLDRYGRVLARSKPTLLPR